MSSVLTVWFLKLSIGTFLLRLVQKPIHVHIIQAVLVIVSLYSLAYVFLVVFQCTPVDHFVRTPIDGSLDFANFLQWKPFGKGKCLPGRVNTNTSYAHAAVIGTSDLIFAILPVFVVRMPILVPVVKSLTSPQVWKLKMNLAMKVLVVGLLGLGGLYVSALFL